MFVFHAILRETFEIFLVFMCKSFDARMPKLELFICKTSKADKENRFIRICIIYVVIGMHHLYDI